MMAGLARLAPRWACAGLLAISALVACDDTSVASGPTVSTDLPALRKLVTLPSGITSARWFVRPRRPPGSRLVPGPTDTLLYAYLETEPDFWLKQGYELPALNSGSVPRLVAEDAKLLLPALILKETSLKGDSYELAKCERRATEALSTAGQPCRSAVRCGSGLLLLFEGN